LVSIQVVVEQIEMAATFVGDKEDKEVQIAKNKGQMESVENHVIAVWMGEEGDDTELFEHEFALVTPQKTDTIPTETFKFSEKYKTQRFRLTLKGLPVLERSGLIEIESRVRRVGSAEWRRQAYPVVYIVRRPEGEHQKDSNGHASSPIN
jgi:hypothetical protein